MEPCFDCAETGTAYVYYSATIMPGETGEGIRKGKVMKPALSLIIMLFLAIQLQAQPAQEWAYPQPVHESAPDSRNVDAIRVFFDISPVLSTDSVFAVWEEKVSENTTKIVFMNMENSRRLIEFSKSGAIFRRPRMLEMRESTSGKESILYLFYETNQNGSWDIYYMKYFGENNFSDPIAVAKTKADEQNYSLGAYRIAWEADGNVLTSKMDENFNWAAPVVVESVNCSMPLVGYYDETIYWLKAIGDSVKICYSAGNESGSLWESPKILFGRGINSSLSLNKGYNGRQMLTWQNRVEDTSRIYMCDLSTVPGTIFEFDRYPGENKYNPALFESKILEGKTPELPIIAFEMETNGMRRIYVSYSPEDLENFKAISDDRFPSFNPKLFEGVLRENILLNKYLFWEQFDSGRMKLYFSASNFTTVAVKEKDIVTVSKPELYQNYPNPFNPSTAITFSVAEAGWVKLKLYDVNGREAAVLFEGEKPAGTHKIMMNAEQLGLNSGVYLYRLFTDKGILSRKMILLK